MSSTPEIENSLSSKLKTENNADSKVLDIGPKESIVQLQTFLRKNLNDIILFTILISLTIIDFFIEAKLNSLNFFFFVIFITGYSLGKRFAVLSAFLTILIVWAFILADKTPYLVHYTHELLYFHITLWGGFLILTGWLGSALKNSFQRKTTNPSQA